MTNQVFNLVNKRKLSVFFTTLGTMVGSLSFDLLSEEAFAQIIVPLVYAFFAGNFGEHAAKAWKQYYPEDQ